MNGLALLMIGLVGGSGVSEYARGLDARRLDQASFDAETYGVKASQSRESEGLRIKLEAGAEETGWKTPPHLKIGGDFTIIVNLVIKKIPKPVQEDGVAIGLAIAQGDINQPDLTLMRLKEPGGADVYRAIDRGGNSPGQSTGAEGPPGMMRPQPRQPNPQPNAKPVKPQRKVFPAAGDIVRLELRREKNSVQFQVLDARLSQPRYLGQIALGTNDIAAVKLFVVNRNGAEPLDVLWRDITIRADRLGGLGTTVRTVFDAVVYADPTAIENDFLIVGGPPKNPPPAAAPKGGKPGEASSTKSAAPPASSDTVDVPAFAPVPASAPPQEAKPKESKESKPKESKPPEPKARIRLDEVESIRFERTPAMTARFVGQINLDSTRPALAEKKDETKKDVAKKDEKDETKKDFSVTALNSGQSTTYTNTPFEITLVVNSVAAGDDALAPPPGTTITKVPRVNPEKNGIRDVCLGLSGLRTSKIKQVTVNCETDKGPTGWRLDTSDSHDWPLVLSRSGTEPWADLYVEPPPGDSFQKDYRINVVYEDGQNANATAKATDHTDAQRAVDPKEPATPRLGATIHLTGEEKLFGTLEGIGPESLRLVCPWRDQGPLDIPLARVVGVQISLPDRKESPESFARRLKSRSAEDLLLGRTKDGEVLAIPGVVEGTEADRLQFRFQDRTRTLPLSQVEGWVMAARPDPKPLVGLLARVSLAAGLTVSGVWKDLDTQTWTLAASWAQELKIPATDVLDVRFRGGAMTYLSDLEPSKVDETPFFGRRMPWRRDAGLLGEPLRMNGQTYEHGVAVHSRSHLTYDLNGHYARFEAVLGFDDAARGKGRVDCRVRADGKELFSRTDLRADEPPVVLSLPVTGAAQLQLEVDFGRDQDTGDRVIWANARLYRPTAVSPAGPVSGTGASQVR